MPEIGEIKSGRKIDKANTTSRYVWAACVDCGKERWVREKEGKPRSTLCRHCSPSLFSRQGENSPHWKGGRVKTGHGYIACKVTTHPRADQRGYVSEHILVWERIHNKSLPENWVIHHLNGIKDDNRPHNLLAMPRGKHSQSFHMEVLKQRIRELESENKLLEKALESSQMIFKISEN